MNMHLRSPITTPISDNLVIFLEVGVLVKRPSSFGVG